MHVAHVSCYVDSLGRPHRELLEAWPTLANVAGAVRRAGAGVTVLQAASEDAVVERDGVRFHFVREPRPPFPTRRWGYWAHPMPRRIADALATVKPDLVHFQSLSFPLQARFLSKRLPGVPMLVQDHADRPLAGWRGRLQRWGLQGIAGVAFTAADQATAFFDAGVLPPEIPVFQVLESSSHFEPGDQLAAREKARLFGNPLLLWAARLDANKDPLTVFEAVKRAAASLPDVQLWCCFTSSPLRSVVDAWLEREPEVAPRVHLLGHIPYDDMETLFRAADFFISGSHSEGSGYAILDALACGTPVLVTDIPPFRRVTGNGAVGALSSSGDAEGMSRAIVEWANGDRVARRKAVRRHFEQRLSFEVIGSDLRSAYETLLSTR